MLLLLILGAHARDSYSRRSLCLSICTVDLEGRCITTAETGTDVNSRAPDI